MTHDVIFEKKVGENWKPVPYAELQAGDVTRMREVGGEVLAAGDGCKEYRVSKVNGVDPDSAHHFDLGLEPLR